MNIKLAFRNLKNLITKSTFSFVIIVLTQIVGVIIVILSYGIIRNVFTQEQNNSLLNRKFTIELSQWIDEDNHTPYLSNSEIKEKYDEFMKTIDTKWSSAYIEGEIEYNGDTYSLGVIDINSPEDEFFKNTKLTYEDFYNGNMVARVSYYEYPAEVGDTINLNGEDYTVIETDEDIPEYGSIF